MRESLLSNKDEQYAKNHDFKINDNNDNNDDDENHWNGASVNDNNSNNNDDDDDDSLYGDYCTSLRTDTGLEIGCRVTWPGCSTVLELSTCLPESSIAPMFNGTQWAGTRLWSASVVAIQYLLHISSSLSSSSNPPSHEDDFIPLRLDQNTTILELGCGLGVPGMILHAMRDCTVILTDLDDLMEQAEQNLIRNFPLIQNNNGKSNNMPNETSESANSDDIKINTVYPQETAEQKQSEEQRRIVARPLDWSVSGVSELIQSLEQLQEYLATRTSMLPLPASLPVVDDDTPRRNGFNVVLCCDCIFEPLYGTSWQQLIECQQELLRINPNTYVLTSVERRNMDGIEKYLEQVVIDTSSVSTSLDLKVEKIDIPFDHPDEIEIYRLLVV